DLHVGFGKALFLERSLEPEMARGEEAVDTDDLALEVGHGLDRRIRLDVERGAETARALPRDRSDHLGHHPFGGGEDNAVRAARGEIDRAGLERLRALVGAG